MVMAARPHKLGTDEKLIQQIVVYLTKGNVALGFLAISVYSMVIPYCDEARAEQWGGSLCGIYTAEGRRLEVAYT